MTLVKLTHIRISILLNILRIIKRNKTKFCICVDTDKPSIYQSFISAQYFKNMEFERKNAYALIVGIVGIVLNQIVQIYNLTLKSHSFVFVQYLKKMKRCNSTKFVFSLIVTDLG